MRTIYWLLNFYRRSLAKKRLLWNHYNYSKLHNLQRTGNKFADIRWVSETIEKILRQLEAQGEFIDEQRVRVLIQ